MRRLGVKRLGLVRGVAGGPNPTFVRDWLFVEALRPLPSLSTLTLVEDGKGSVPQLLGRRLVERAVQQTVLPAQGSILSLDRLAGVERMYEPTAVTARPDSQKPVYALPVHVPAAGRMIGLFLRIGSSDLYRVLP